MHRRDMISIWFFIGVMLLCYGVIILISAVAVTPAQPTALAEYHAGLWWGVLLTVVGAGYSWLFRPGRP